MSTRENFEEILGTGLNPGRDQIEDAYFEARHGGSSRPGDDMLLELNRARAILVAESGNAAARAGRYERIAAEFWVGKSFKQARTYAEAALALDPSNGNCQAMVSWIDDREQRQRMTGHHELGAVLAQMEALAEALHRDPLAGDRLRAFLALRGLPPELGEVVARRVASRSPTFPDLFPCGSLCLEPRRKSSVLRKTLVPAGFLAVLVVITLLVLWLMN
jgi:hypothetical protein